MSPGVAGMSAAEQQALIAQSQAVGYDPAALAGLAAGLGISGADWTAATEEFAARAQTNPAVGREMGQIAREGRA